MRSADKDELRDFTRRLLPDADFDLNYVFYYCETNNIRKSCVNEIDLNYLFQSSFVLGGLVHSVDQLEIKDLFDWLSLHKSMRQLSVAHLAKGDFLSFLNSKKLGYFLGCVLDSDICIHYTVINVLYYSLVDIVVSALFKSDFALFLDAGYLRFLKNAVYKIAKIEKTAFLSLFYRYGYPFIKKELIPFFVRDLVGIFEGYAELFEEEVSLISLNQILLACKKEYSEHALTDEKDFVLLKNFSESYLRRIYLFENSFHVFDEAGSVRTELNDYTFRRRGIAMIPYSVEDSKNNLFIQVSGVLVDLVGKLSVFINTSSRENLERSIRGLNKTQSDNLDKFLSLINKSQCRNPAFIHTVDSLDETLKMKMLYELRGRQSGLLKTCNRSVKSFSDSRASQFSSVVL